MRLHAVILALVAVVAPAFAAEPATKPATTASTAVSSEAAPKVVVPEFLYSFGIVQPNDVLEHTFVIKNEGNAPLEITHVSANCKCTAVHYDKVIPPGRSGNIVAAVDTRMVEGESLGELTVETNDPKMAHFVLHTKVDVRSKLRADPGYARWNMVQGEAEGTINQTVTAADGADFHVLKVEAPPGIRTSFRPATAEEKKETTKGAEWHVETTLESNAPVGPVEGYVEIVTDHPLQPRLRIPISGFVRPVVHVTPPAGTFGTVMVDDGNAKGNFIFQNFATEKIEVVSARSSVKGIDVKVVPIEAGRKYAIDLHLDPRMPAGPFSGVIRIETDSKRAPMLEVPVDGTVTHATADKKPSSSGASGTTTH